MPRCYAKNCNSDTRNKIRMFVFPRNEIRRQIWMEKCGRDDVNPHAKLCEHHFDESQYEKNRADGWRKLKPNAVPTLFYDEILSEIKEMDTSIIIRPNIGEVEEQDNEENCYTEYSILDEAVLSDKDEGHNELSEYLEARIAGSTHELSTINSINDNLEFTDFEIDSQIANELLSKIKFLQYKLIEEQGEKELLRKKLIEAKKSRADARQKTKIYQKRYDALQEKFEEIPFFKFFSPGILQQQPNWSPESIKLATQIRNTVGWKTYIYMRKSLGLPLPSCSTICRNIKSKSPTVCENHETIL